MPVKPRAGGLVSSGSYRFWAVFGLLPDQTWPIELPVSGCGHPRAGGNVLVQRVGRREYERCRVCHNTANTRWRRRVGVPVRNVGNREAGE